MLWSHSSTSTLIWNCKWIVTNNVQMETNVTVYHNDNKLSDDTNVTVYHDDNKLLDERNATFYHNDTVPCCDLEDFHQKL